MKDLQAAGYTTAMLGKWHMGLSGRPRDYFDHWVSFKGQGKYRDPLFNINGKLSKHKGYTTDLLTNKAVRFIRDQPADKPYFLMLSHKAVHEPFDAADRQRTAFGVDTQPAAPASWSFDLRGKPQWQRRQLVRDVRWDWRTRDAEKETVPATIPPTAWENDLRPLFQYRCLASVDEGVGRILDALQERGTRNNTLIIFTSDNGYFHWEHRRWDKRLAYEESMRIPMILSLPGRIRRNSTVRELVGNIDFAPTVLDYAGVAVPARMQGRSMKPLLDGQDIPWRDSFFYEYWGDLVHEIPTTIAVRTQRHKLIQFPELNDTDELYDLVADPHEINNLAGDPDFADLHAEMQKRLADAARKAKWQPRIFPRNLDRIRGRTGLLLDVRANDGRLVCSTGQHPVGQVPAQEDSLVFDGAPARLEIPFDEESAAGTWPYEITVEFRANQDGVVVMQSSKRNGFKIFVDQGRPGIAVRCSTWTALTTTIDGPRDITGKWTRVAARIDYNRLDFYVNDRLVESRALPQPFRYRTRSPLIMGNVNENTVRSGLPHQPFNGLIRSLQIKRPAVK